MGGEGDDTLDGGQGRDVVDYEMALAPVLASLYDGTATGQGDDSLISIEGLIGSPNDDVLTGNDATNLFLPLGGDDSMDGLGGSDIVVFLLAPVTANLATGIATGEGTDTLAGIETLVGSAGDDTLTGSDGDDVLFGASGDDHLDGGLGTDDLDGGNGTDTCVNGENVANCEG
jgi:hypothetical protein